MMSNVEAEAESKDIDTDDTEAAYNAEQEEEASEKRRRLLADIDERSVFTQTTDQKPAVDHKHTQTETKIC